MDFVMHHIRVALFTIIMFIIMVLDQYTYETKPEQLLVP